MGYYVDCCGVSHFHRKVGQMLFLIVVTAFLVVMSAVIAVVYGDD